MERKGGKGKRRGRLRYGCWGMDAPDKVCYGDFVDKWRTSVWKLKATIDQPTTRVISAVG